MNYNDIDIIDIDIGIGIGTDADGHRQGLHHLSNFIGNLGAPSIAKTLVRCGTSTARDVYDALIVEPLRRLYLGGPRLWGWGFWGGIALPDICAAVSTAPATFWWHHQDACAALVLREFSVLLVALETVVYFYILVNVMVLAWRAVGLGRYLTPWRARRRLPH
jgi:hypothetical protein